MRYANPGALHHARWVTLCNRVLRYYISQKEPTRELVRDVTFAVHVYIPGWFLTIKRQSFVEGPRILQQVVANLQCLAVEKYWHPDDAKKKERRVVSELGLMQRCLSDNAYFAHKENLLLCMLCDLERPDFRMRAAKRTILKIRKLRTNEEGLRAFVPPEVNWETSTSYDRFISDADFKDLQNLHEPPVTMSWSQQEIMDVARDPFKLRHVPAHTTPVERQISLGTQLAKNYQVEDCAPEDKRFEQEMANMKAGHSIMPSYQTCSRSKSP